MRSIILRTSICWVNLVIQFPNYQRSCRFQTFYRGPSRALLGQLSLKLNFGATHCFRCSSSMVLEDTKYDRLIYRLFLLPHTERKAFACLAVSPTGALLSSTFLRAAAPILVLGSHRVPHSPPSTGSTCAGWSRITCHTSTTVSKNQDWLLLSKCCWQKCHFISAHTLQTQCRDRIAGSMIFHQPITLLYLHNLR